MGITKVSQGGTRKWKVAACVLLLSTITFLSLFIYDTIKDLPCANEPCHNGGTCVVVEDSFNCFCRFGYNGSKCEESPCSTEPCLYGGSCTIDGTSYVCSCQDGYTGTQCEETPCSNQPCLNKGTCDTLGSSYVCHCPDGYKGANCEATPCSDHPCLNGGTCTVDGSSFHCSCLPRHTGTSCEEYDNCGINSDCVDNTACPSGIYKLQLTNTTEVYCNMEVDNGGWIVIQRRINGEVDFYRDWNSYKYGFGDLDGGFWLGNELIHEITSRGNYMLRVDLEDFEGSHRFETYATFVVESESSECTQRLSGHTGITGNSMYYNNGIQFSTTDRNNIIYATSYVGAWWFRNTYYNYSHLNGRYLNGRTASTGQGIYWQYWKGGLYSLKKSSMMLRRK